MIKIICNERQGWCGPACVQEVLRRYGIKRTQEQIAYSMGTNVNGTSPGRIKQYLNQQFLSDAHSVYVPGCTLELAKDWLNWYSLVIVDWMNGRNDEDGHYAILEYVDKDCVILNDPDYPGSLRMLDRKTFEKQWYDFENGKKIERLAILI